MKQLTFPQANLFFDRELYLLISPEDAVYLQLYQRFQLMPYDFFNEHMERIVKQPMITKNLCEPRFTAIKNRFLNKTGREEPTTATLKEILPKEIRQLIFQNIDNGTDQKTKKTFHRTR